MLKMWIERIIVLNFAIYVRQSHITCKFDRNKGKNLVSDEDRQGGRRGLQPPILGDLICELPFKTDKDR